MQEADHITTTPIAAVELSKLHRALADVADTHDCAMLRATKAMDALDLLIFDRPINTLADAAAVAVHAFTRLESVPQSDGELEQLRLAFGRIAVVAADAAGIQLEELGSGADSLLRAVKAMPGSCLDEESIIARAADLLRA